MNAPSSPSGQFCAETPISVSASACTASASETYGGQTTTSTRRRDRPSRSARQNSPRLGRPLEHLPVAGDQHGQASGIAATPGSSLPSSSSSEAPPPVEIHEIRSATPASCDGAHRVAAADDREAVAVGDRPRDREGALGEARPLEDAHRAVPEDGLARRRSAARSPRAVCGPMSSPSQPSGSVVERRRPGSRRPRRTRRQRRRRSAGRLERERVLGADVLGHLAADQHRVGARAEVAAARATLSSTFAPPETITNGRSTSPSRRPRCSSSASSSRPA